MTDRQQLERLMAIVKQARDAQHTYFKNRKTVSAEHAKKLLNDARMKENSHISREQHVEKWINTEVPAQRKHIGYNHQKKTA